MTDTASTCPRHPDTPTRLRCSSCEELICPQCWRDAPVGYHCPDCAERRNDAARRSAERISGTDRDGRLPTPVLARSTAAGLSASVLGGLLLGPVLVGGAFFLISAGVIGWLVARAVFWASAERSSPFLRAVAITFAGFTVAVGFATAGAGPAPAGLAVLAYPAALWGGWIVVRQR